MPIKTADTIANIISSIFMAVFIFFLFVISTMTETQKVKTTIINPGYDATREIKIAPKPFNSMLIPFPS
jgi:hypothetical protein